jgi:hypothetical protein
VAHVGARRIVVVDSLGEEVELEVPADGVVVALDKADRDEEHALAPKPRIATPKTSVLQRLIDKGGVLNIPQTLDRSF